MQLERARQIRGARRGSRWWRPLGVLLTALATFAALDPDYPLPRQLPTTGSAVAGAGLMPEAVAPRGAVPAGDFAFRWVAADGASELVLLDDQLDEIYRRRVNGNCLPVDAALRKTLEGLAGAEGRLHWYVIGEVGGQPRRSPPVAIEFCR